MAKNDKGVFCNLFAKVVLKPNEIFSKTKWPLIVPVPRIYGEIKRKEDGTLYTTRAQRTGCSMCGFGIHLEDRPHRFDRLREDNPKEWRFWMYNQGWGKVLDYIGVAWEDEPAQIGGERS